MVPRAYTFIRIFATGVFCGEYRANLQLLRTADDTGCSFVTEFATNILKIVKIVNSGPGLNPDEVLNFCECLFNYLV